MRDYNSITDNPKQYEFRVYDAVNKVWNPISINDIINKTVVDIDNDFVMVYSNADSQHRKVAVKYLQSDLTTGSFVPNLVLNTGTGTLSPQETYFITYPNKIVNLRGTFTYFGNTVDENVSFDIGYLGLPLTPDINSNMDPTVNGIVNIHDDGLSYDPYPGILMSTGSGSMQIRFKALANQGHYISFNINYKSI